MTFRSVIVALIFGLTFGTYAHAQIGGGFENGRLPTVAELLQKRGIALNSSALVAALQSQEAEVRELAAQKLAEDKAKDSIPSIEQALAAETQKGTKLNIAFALGQLGDEKGTNALTDACRNSALNTGLRLRAVRYLLNLDNEVCLSAVVDLLESQREGDSNYRAEALSLLPSFKRGSTADSQKVLLAVYANLTNPAPDVRLSASDVLSRLGDARAIPHLQNAIAAEHDDEVRSQLTNALQRLQKSLEKQ